jgi:hypothetical protein
MGQNRKLKCWGGDVIIMMTITCVAVIGSTQVATMNDAIEVRAQLEKQHAVVDRRSRH